MFYNILIHIFPCLTSTLRSACTYVLIPSYTLCFILHYLYTYIWDPQFNVDSERLKVRVFLTRQDNHGVTVAILEGGKKTLIKFYFSWPFVRHVGHVRHYTTASAFIVKNKIIIPLLYFKKEVFCCTHNGYVRIKII